VKAVVEKHPHALQSRINNPRWNGIFKFVDSYTIRLNLCEMLRINLDIKDPFVFMASDNNETGGSHSPLFTCSWRGRVFLSSASNDAAW
jgi:hypothetical protein